MGIDFSISEAVPEFANDDTKGHHYQPSQKKLLSVLDLLPITSQDSILDLGCGKGQAMYYMSKFPFTKIDGYDISEKLCQTARHNLATLGIEFCQIFHANAETFDQYDQYNYFYLYNPFPEPILDIVMKKIHASLERNPRKAYFIYMSPFYHSCILKYYDFELLFIKKSFSKSFQVNCYTTTSN